MPCKKTSTANRYGQLCPLKDNEPPPIPPGTPELVHVSRTGFARTCGAVFSSGHPQKLRDRHPNTKDEIGEPATYSVITTGMEGETTLVRDARRSHVEVNMKKIEGLAHSSFPTYRTFVLVLAEVNLHTDSKGRMLTMRLAAPLRRLVEDGTYASMEAVQADMEKVKKYLVGLSVNGYVHAQGGDRQISDLFEDHTDARGNVTRVSLAAPLFKLVAVDGEFLMVVLNEYINWELFNACYVSLPPEIFSMSPRAFKLTVCIGVSACYKRNMEKTATKGAFNIPFADAQAELGLLPVDATESPMRDCITPVLKAIEEIEEKTKGAFCMITAMYEEGAPASVISTRGYIEIRPQGRLLHEAIKAKKKKQEEAAARRRARARAKARALQDQAGIDIDLANASAAPQQCNLSLEGTGKP